MIVNYPFKFYRKNEKVIYYEDLSKIKITWGGGGTQEFIKFYRDKESVKFVSRKWDIEDIVMILNGHCNRDIFDLNACEIIDERLNLEKS